MDLDKAAESYVNRRFPNTTRDTWEWEEKLIYDSFLFGYVERNAEVESLKASLYNRNCDYQEARIGARHALNFLASVGDVGTPGEKGEIIDILRRVLKIGRPEVGGMSVKNKRVRNNPGK